LAQVQPINRWLFVDINTEKVVPKNEKSEKVAVYV